MPTYTLLGVSCSSCVTFAQVGTVPANPATAASNTQSGTPSKTATVSIQPTAQRSSRATSQVLKQTRGVLLSVDLQPSGSAMSASGYARCGSNPPLLPPASTTPAMMLAPAAQSGRAGQEATMLTLELAGIELRGSKALLVLRLSLAKGAASRQSLSADLAPAGIPRALGFNRSRERQNVYELAFSLGANRRKPGVFEVRNTFDSKIIEVDHQVDARDFEVDLHRCQMRYLGHFDENGKRSTRLTLRLAPGVDPDDLSAELLGFEELPERGAQNPADAG